MLGEGPQKMLTVEAVTLSPDLAGQSHSNGICVRPVRHGARCVIV